MCTVAVDATDQLLIFGKSLSFIGPASSSINLLRRVIWSIRYVRLHKMLSMFPAHSECDASVVINIFRYRDRKTSKKS